jgi:hypothetical protein
MFKKMIIVAAMAILAISAQVGTASANLVTNGGFETGNFSGWTLTNGALDGYTFVVLNSLNPTSPPNPGIYEASLSTNGAAGAISQTLNTTAGQGYIVTYWLANDDSSKTNLFQAMWNNSTIQATALANSDIFGYKEFQFSAVASGSSSTLAFNFQNDPSTFHLDNVDATPTPIPAAAWLLGSGLMGLVGLRRRKK